jgi:hypothetical protein
MLETSLGPIRVFPLGEQADATARLSGFGADAVVLLAQGILRQYERVLGGREIVRQDDRLPPELQAAMCKLGRLYIEEGMPDRAACIHDVLERARHALGSHAWELGLFTASEFPFRNAVLIDPELRVPTVDCVSIARISGGVGEDNVIEHRLHATLRDAVERLGPARDRAYTAIRELLGRRSLIGELELARWVGEQKLTPVHGIFDELFERVADAWLIGGRANRCADCGTLLRPHPDLTAFPDGHCPLRTCTPVRYRAAERLDPAADRLLVARPQVLTYWTAPAVDELRIYDAAVAAGLPATLYPASDECDVAVELEGVRVGIDAKAYASPVTLALTLNRGIGGLVNYRTRIIAVSDGVIARDPGYVQTLLSCLDRNGDAATLRIRAVSAVVNMLQGGRDAGPV